MSEGPFDWLHSGVNASAPGNGGPECAAFLTPSRRLLETAVTLTIAAATITWGYKNLSNIPEPCGCHKDNVGKRILLIFTCLMWGMEIGFKCASKTVIYLLNPCHITTALQIYLLSAPPSKFVTFVYRLQLNFLNGAILACAFPWTETRLFPFEKSIYWIQHTMMVIVPYYLLRLGGPYNVEKYSDFSWCSMAYGVNLVYHFVILQTVAIFLCHYGMLGIGVTATAHWLYSQPTAQKYTTVEHLFRAIPLQVNLNLMLCPMELDPFYGPYYRIVAVGHQALLCPLTSKLFHAGGDLLISKLTTPLAHMCKSSCRGCSRKDCKHCNMIDHQHAE